MVSLNEVRNRIRKAGVSNVRMVPMAGQSALDGNYQIEILEDSQWSVLVDGLPKTAAEVIIRNSNNKLILG